MEIANPPTDPVRSSRILESSVGRGRGRWKFKNDNTFGRAKIPRLSIFIDFVGKKETIGGRGYDYGERWTREIGGKGKGCNDARGVFNELEDTGKGWKLA